MNSNLRYDNPLFSVIVPAYNSEKYLEKCIQSVLQQDCTEFELLIVDDGSVDSTFELACRYANEECRIKVFHKENGGHTSARNKGLENSKGKYLIFLDSDDWLDPNVLTACKEEIDMHPVDIIVFGMTNTANNSLSYIGVKDGYYQIQNENSNILNSLIMNENGKCVFSRSLSAKCFRRELVYENQLSLPEKIKIGEDGAVFMVSSMKAKYVSVKSDIHYNCLVRSDSISHSSDVDAFKRLPYLLQYLLKNLNESDMLFQEQFDRYVVSKLYSAAQFVVRGKKDSKYINDEYNKILQYEYVQNALENAKFKKAGYKYKVKQFIVKHRLWFLIKIFEGG